MGSEPSRQKKTGKFLHVGRYVRSGKLKALGHSTSVPGWGTAGELERTGRPRVPPSGDRVHVSSFFFFSPLRSVCACEIFLLVTICEPTEQMTQLALYQLISHIFHIFLHSYKE